MSKGRYVSSYLVAMTYAGLEDRERALSYLERACEERSTRVVELKFEPAFRALRGESRYEALVERLHLN
jgi:hypothetical protein